jgi:hypothetical protein
MPYPGEGGTNTSLTPEREGIKKLPPYERLPPTDITDKWTLKPTFYRQGYAPTPYFQSYTKRLFTVQCGPHPPFVSIVSAPPQRF